MRIKHLLLGLAVTIMATNVLAQSVGTGLPERLDEPPRPALTDAEQRHWRSFMAGQDLVWDTGPIGFFNGAFIGDGKAGAMFYRDPDEPDVAARATRTGRFGCVAVLLSSDGTRSSFATPLQHGIHDALAEHDLHMLVARLPDAKLTSTELTPKILRQWMADGLLINYTDHIPRGLIRMIRRSDAPAVWLNSKQPHDCVRPDDLRAGRDATEHLIALGHRQIVYVDYAHGADDLHEAHYSARDRQAGYERSMRRAGLEPRAIRLGRYTPLDRARGHAAGWCTPAWPPRAPSPTRSRDPAAAPTPGSAPPPRVRPAQLTDARWR